MMIVWEFSAATTSSATLVNERSEWTPKPPRIAVLVSLNGAHTNPSLGCRFEWSFGMPRMSLYDASRSYLRPRFSVTPPRARQPSCTNTEYSSLGRLMYGLKCSTLYCIG